MTFSTLASPGVSLQGGGGSGGGGGGTPGGSNTQIQYNNSGAFAGASGLTTNGTELTIASGTKTADAPVLNMSQTWNNGAVTFTGLKFNATDTASASGSLLMDLQVGGTSIFGIRRAFITGSKFNRAVLSVPQYTYTAASTGGFFAIGPDESSPNMLLNIGTGAGIDFQANSPLRWTNSASNAAAGTPDLLLSRRGAANLRLGAADTTGTTAPTPQFLSAQSWASSTTNNQTGANFTIDGSQGTGTGAGGSIIFRVAPASGTSNGVQNGLVNALMINSAREAAFETASGTGIYLNYTGAGLIQFRSSGTDRAYIFGQSNGILEFGSANSQIMAFQGTTAGFRFRSVTSDVFLHADANDTLAQRNGANAQESRVYGSFTATDNFQRMSIKTLRESSGALSGATYVTTIAIPAYANLIGVTTRVTTAVTGATSYSVGDGSDVDLWGGTIGVTLGSQSRTADFTAVAAVGAAAASRTVTLTANGSNFTGGVIEICLHYLTTEAD